MNKEIKKLNGIVKNLKLKPQFRLQNIKQYLIA